MRDGCADFSAELREFNGGAEHLPLVSFPLTVANSQLVNRPKGLSSRRLRQEVPDPRRHYWPAKRSGRVALRRVGRPPPISVLRQYIEQQNRPARPAHIRPPT
jgi:putative transposase